MNLNRRDVIKASGYAVVGTMVSQAITGTAGAVSGDFDINASFATFMRDIGGTPGDAGGKVIFTGEDPILRSHFRIGASMAMPAMAAGLGAAAIWRERTGAAQDLKVDLRESVLNVNPLVGGILRMSQAAGAVPAADPLPANFTFLLPTNRGLMLQAPIGLGNPMTFVPFETKDGRFFNVTGAYPHLEQRALQALKVPPGRDNLVRGFRQVNAFEFEDELNALGGVGVVHRTRAEWLAHPEGATLAKLPVIEIIKIADGPPVPWAQDPTQPLSGIKALSATHVIAGTCSSRTLAEYGAEVLHIARDQSFEHEALVIEVNAGMRSAFVDMRNPDQNKRLKALVPQADVFVESFRIGAMERLGFGVDELKDGHKGLVYLSINANSPTGPWAPRGGFDMEGLSTSGFTMEEGAGGPPRFPPTLIMNDFIAGYLGAAGAIAALRRRAREGGSYHVRVSLTRAAMWYAGLGRFGSTDFDPNDPKHRMIDPETLIAQTPYGEIRRLGPQVKLSKTPGRWRTPLVAVRGGDPVNCA